MLITGTKKKCRFVALKENSTKTFAFHLKITGEHIENTRWQPKQKLSTVLSTSIFGYLSLTLVHCLPNAHQAMTALRVSSFFVLYVKHHQSLSYQISIWLIGKRLNNSNGETKTVFFIDTTIGNLVWTVFVTLDTGLWMDFESILIKLGESLWEFWMYRQSVHTDNGSNGMVVPNLEWNAYL